MNNIIKFRDEDHSYWEDDVKYISVNTVVKLFGFYFDADFWLVYKAFKKYINDFWRLFREKGFDLERKKPKPSLLIRAFRKELRELDLNVEEITVDIQDEWNESARKGTEFHNEQEAKAYEQGFVISPFDGKKYKVHPKMKIPKGFDNKASLKWLSNLKDGAYMELLIFSPLFKVAGQADEVFVETIDGVTYIDIGDHKTNKDKPKLSNKYGYCKEPISHIEDCKYRQYNFQLSMYGKLLEMLGYKIRNLAIYHYKNYDVNKRTIINYDYLSDECENLLKIYLEKHL